MRNLCKKCFSIEYKGVLHNSNINFLIKDSEKDSAYLRLLKLQCIAKSDFANDGDECIRDLSRCPLGVSFSIWLKAEYDEDVLNVHKVHKKKYIFSTGE